jgi:sugar phosphate isomerase/epimerase
MDMSDLPRLRADVCHAAGRRREEHGQALARVAAAGVRSSGLLSRRNFLNAAALAFGAAGAYGQVPGAWAATGPVDAVRQGRPFKISLGQWSLHKELLAKRLDPRDFAKAANGLGIDAIEYVSQFYAGKASDSAYLAELKRRAAGEGVWSALLVIDTEGELGAPDAKARKRVVDRHKKWVEAAAFLGCHAVRVNTASQGSEDDQANWVSDGLRRLCEFSDTCGVDVLVENRGGLSSKASWLAEVLQAVGHPRIGSRPDFGSFDLGRGEAYDRYKGVRELMPFARAVSAKTYDFDERGNETSINFPLMLQIVSDAGYHGYVAIEYDGQRLSEHAGIERTKALLERVRTQIASRSERRG